MKINRQNYQEIFLDFFEGRLNQSQISELMAFLELNPDLKEEFDSFELISLEPAPVTEHFEYLKKNINDLKLVSTRNFDEVCIAYFEGDLKNAVLIKQLNEIVKLDHHYSKAYHLYSNTKLKPEETITFISKAELKHYSLIYKRTNIPVRLAAMAASIALLTVIYTIFSHLKNKTYEIMESKSSIAAITEAPKNANNESLELQKPINKVNTIVKTRIHIQNKTKTAMTKTNQVKKNQASDNHISLAALESKMVTIHTPVLKKNLEPTISLNLNKIQFEAIGNNNQLYSFSEKAKNTFNQLKNNLFGNQHINGITDKVVVEQLTRLLGSQLQINFDRDSIANRKIIKINAGNFNYYSSVALK